MTKYKFDFVCTIEGEIFDTKKATYICSSEKPHQEAGYEEGRGRWRELYRTEKGTWVILLVSCWHDERNEAHIVSEKTAQTFILKYGNSEDIEKYC